MPIVKKLRKPCARCDKMFVPATKNNRLCAKCNKIGKIYPRSTKDCRSFLVKKYSIKRNRK